MLIVVFFEKRTLNFFKSLGQQCKYFGTKPYFKTEFNQSSNQKIVFRFFIKKEIYFLFFQKKKKVLYGFIPENLKVGEDLITEFSTIFYFSETYIHFLEQMCRSFLKVKTRLM